MEFDNNIKGLKKGMDKMHFCMTDPKLISLNFYASSKETRHDGVWSLASDMPDCPKSYSPLGGGYLYLNRQTGELYGDSGDFGNVPPEAKERFKPGILEQLKKTNPSIDNIIVEHSGSGYDERWEEIRDFDGLDYNVHLVDFSVRGDRVAPFIIIPEKRLTLSCYSGRWDVPREMNESYIGFIDNRDGVSTLERDLDPESVIKVRKIIDDRLKELK